MGCITSKKEIDSCVIEGNKLPTARAVQKPIHFGILRPNDNVLELWNDAQDKLTVRCVKHSTTCRVQHGINGFELIEVLPFRNFNQQRKGGPKWRDVPT